MRPVEPTRSTLLSRLRDTDDQASWREFEARYRELIIRFCRARGGQLADAEDIAQAVFASLVRALPGFTYDRQRGRFRDYLFRCVRAAASEHARAAARAGTPLEFAPASRDAETADPQAATIWEREWMAHHYRLALAELERTFDASSVAVLRQSLSGQSPAAIAEALGLTPDAVYKARQRVRARVEEIIARQVVEEDALD
ncbi:MAG: RNA polymerase sigma factor [Phycisphaerales bacterium]